MAYTKIRVGAYYKSKPNTYSHHMILIQSIATSGHATVLTDADGDLGKMHDVLHIDYIKRSYMRITRLEALLGGLVE